MMRHERRENNVKLTLVWSVVFQFLPLRLNIKEHHLYTVLYVRDPSGTSTPQCINQLLPPRGYMYLRCTHGNPGTLVEIVIHYGPRVQMLGKI